MKSGDYCRLLLLAAIWGGSFLFMRVAAPAFGAINTAFLRVLFGFVGLVVILAVLRTPRDYQHKFGRSLLLGVINSGLPFLMYCLAARWLPAGYSAILNATTPLMGVVLGGLFFHETVTLKKALGVLTGLFGITLLTTTGSAESVPQLLAGVIACLVATGCYAVAGFLTRRWISERGGLDPKLVATGSQLGATLFLLPFFLYTSATEAPVTWAQPLVWLCVLAVGFICTAWAYILYFRLIADIGPLRSMTVTFLIPPFGILWGYLLLNEKLSEGFFAGGILICVAVWLVLSPGKSVAGKTKTPAPGTR
ncbi:DMT family transporter (plasmid) [Rahnella aceris]